MTDKEAGPVKHDVKFGKKLANTDKKVRDAGFKLVQKWLKDHGKDLEALDMMKLWKSLWYAFWMSDKAPVQRELAVNLSLTMHSIDEERWALWVAAFWETIQTSWEKIDRHRMDKYLMLMRCFLAETLKYVRTRKWDTDLIEDLNQMLVDVSPLVPNVTEGLGVSMQYAGMWMSEFMIQHEETACPQETFMLLLEPFFDLIIRGNHQSLSQQVQTKVFRETPDMFKEVVQTKLLDISGDENLHKDKRATIHDTVLFMKGEKKDKPHPLLGLRRRPIDNEKPQWAAKRKRKD